MSFGGLELAPFPVPQQEGQFDVTLELLEGDTSLTVGTDLIDFSRSVKPLTPSGPFPRKSITPILRTFTLIFIHFTPIFVIAGA